jgi:hypothetical protein
VDTEVYVAVNVGPVAAQEATDHRGAIKQAVFAEDQTALWLDAVSSLEGVKHRDFARLSQFADRAATHGHNRAGMRVAAVRRRAVEVPSAAMAKGESWQQLGDR